MRPSTINEDDGELMAIEDDMNLEDTIEEVLGGDRHIPSGAPGNIISNNNMSNNVGDEEETAPIVVKSSRSSYGSAGGGKKRGKGAGNDDAV
jgi:hypothetical protein